ncbi:iron-siderophore ABC transporter substrate-binding protein [Paenibacillus psychroresistens]|uniref:Iron-siderophore ABC transporter substrate-binding protein n=1 Tax=Paenibacillus psychroresistens TaxID=1778678 RepID=A0A6B8RTT7_9BACL|nr:iron-siderophore ABC transporter substrate-binding protein [Paenibacillus psychroresistens]QGQ99811.1 iron-siderophore ABC transporter substrate-binding protein [Paenibacillus psychroresistens]
MKVRGTQTNGNRTAWFGMLMLILVMVLSGCGSKETSDNANQTNSTATNPPETAANTDNQVRKVKHAMGETEIKGTPLKVVVLTNEGTEALLALGVKPIGAVKSWTGDPWYDHIKADMEGVTVLGEEGQPNLELIAGLQPDLIIGNKKRQEKIYEQLKAIAPTVLSEDLRGEWKINFNLYAEALGKTAEGDVLMAAFDKRIEDFKVKAGDKLKQTVSVVRFMAGKTRVYHTNTFSGVIFDKIGIARTEMTKNAKDAFVDEINKERLPEADADRIFFFTYETGDGKANQTEQEWTNDSLWKNLNAVKNGQAYKVDDAIWNTAGGIKAANLMLDEMYKIYEIKQ